jgi:hypothetical protein
MAIIKEKEYLIKDNGFEYHGKMYDCSYAIKRDIKMILQEAETSHKGTFDELYDRQSLKAGRIRIYLDKEDKPIFGMVIYSVEYKDKRLKRCACGGYYPFRDNQLFPHLYQESICW